LKATEPKGFRRRYISQASAFDIRGMLFEHDNQSFSNSNSKPRTSLNDDADSPTAKWYALAPAAYIVNQAEHHKKFSYQEEIREIFKRHRVAFDERYVWD